MAWQLLQLGLFMYSRQNRTLPLKFDCKNTLRPRNTRYKNPHLVAQHCFVASFRRCLEFFTWRDQLDPQQKHLFWVEEMRRADWLIS